MANNLGKTMFRVGKRDTSKWLSDASINTKKYLNEHEGGLIGPHISPWIRYKGGGNSLGNFHFEGFFTKFPLNTSNALMHFVSI
jgi:hypothetical protein